MDVFEAHKYLDPTTFDDSSFLSFSSFADLTRSPYDEFITLPVSPSVSQKPSRHLTQPQHQSRSFGLYQSFDQQVLSLGSLASSTPPSSHSDCGSETTASPHLAASSSFYTPITPASHDFGIFHSPSSSPLVNCRAGPSKLSYPTINTTSHHVSQRSSDSSDWNLPLTPSLTYKSSVDSLASFAPEQDFYLPPSSSHTAFGWDDQSLGSSSSLAPRSPPSPSPHRVASNPTLGKNRHPRSVQQVKSLPSLREEGVASMDPNNLNDDFASLLAEFTETDYTNFESLADTSPEANWTAALNSHTDISGTIFETMGDLDLNALADAYQTESSTSRGSTSNGTFSSEQTANIDQFLYNDNSPVESSGSVMLTSAPSLVPDTSSASNSTNLADLNICGWEPEVDYTSDAFAQSGDYSVQPPIILTTSADNTYRPVTAPEPLNMSRYTSSSFNLAVPPQGMMRSVSSSAVQPVKSALQQQYSYTPQQSQTGPLASMPMFQNHAAIDPQLMGMSSSKPMELPSPPLVNRRPSQSLGIDIAAATQYGIYQQQGQFARAPLSAPYAVSKQPGYPMSLQQESIGMKRVGSQPLPGARMPIGHPINFYQPSYSSGTQYSEAERQRIRADVASRRVSMEQASVMQPWVPPTIPAHMLPLGALYQPQQQQQQQQQVQEPQYLGWESPDSTTSATQYTTQQFQGQSQGSTGSMMTNATLNNVHPPATSYHPNPHSRISSASMPVQQHRVHPPPHSALPVQQQRPIARMPSGTPANRGGRKASVSAKPKARPSPAGRKKNMPVSGIQEHGGIFFANYTPNDGHTLLKGVAPSGSQSKRKREASAALLSVPMGHSASGSDLSGDEDSRSKRSKSSSSGIHQ